MTLQFDKAHMGNMDRGSMDLNGLSRSFQKNYVIISHAGVDQSFSVYQHALISHFSRTPMAWKVNNKLFPHRLTFSLKFVPYEDALCFGPQITPTEVTKIAFLHIFNINVTSADDYRTNVRHNVSDWFAKLNSKSDVQWIIVINTNRAKDRKTKNTIIEKIKADFAKYSSRLFDLPDTSDQNAFVNFVQGIQQFLFTHLTLVMEIWDKALKTQYERKRQHTWEPFAYFSSMTEYGRLFWSFGAIEYAMSIFDDLEKFLHEYVIRSGENDSPKWIAHLLDTKIDDRPALISNFSTQRLEKKEAHYLGMRNYLLCQQILMSIHLYQHKMKSNDAAPSLRSDCAVGIMQRTMITIEAVKEYNNLMNNKRDVAVTCCWTWWTVSESLSICQLLCDVSHLNVAPVILARLHFARFDALYVLAKQLKLNPEDGQQLSEWLNMKPTSLESKMLTSAIRSNEQMCTEMEKAHDVCVSALNHANRQRFLLNATYKLFSYLRSVNSKRPLHKLSINKQMLKTMPNQESTAQMLKSLCSEFLQSDSVNNEILSLIFFISQCESGQDEKINELFLEKCQRRAKDDEKPVDIRSISINDELFNIQVENFEAVQTTDSILEIHALINSKISFPMKNVKFELIFSGDPSSHISQESNLSVLSLQHEMKENVCRLVSELKLKNETSQQLEYQNSPLILNFQTELSILKPGENSIVFRTDISKIGCFVLEKVRIATDSIEYSTCNVITRRPAVLYCISTPHSVAVVNESQHLYAGVMQDLEIEVEARCDIAKETILEIDPSTPNFQFLGNEYQWTESFKVSLQPFKSMEKRRIHVQVWLKIDSSICESAAVQKKSILVRWMNRRYNLCLLFVPVMVINSKTSMLTTDILLEVELNRAAGPNITTVIESATLTSEPLNVDSGDAGRLVATPLCKFPLKSSLLSIVNMVWKLPTKGSLVKHRLHLEYTVKNQDPHLKYTFDDVVELTVPDVQFEICTQVLSQQPGAQLCRATSPCHFVISIRFLKEMPCTLLVVLDADERMWTLVERTKMVTVKDSGLGQLALAIIPVVAGYLPFPNVSIYECQLVSDAITPGNAILFFNRTAGKQIRVLSPNNSENNNFGKDDSSRGSNRIKKTIEKLFD